MNRYDARLLLDTLMAASAPHTIPSSPGGWSDLPSDTEDTFFFAPDEAEDFRREKRRRLMNQNREERLKARRAEDGDDDDDEEVWGGSDEDVGLFLAAIWLRPISVWVPNIHQDSKYSRFCTPFLFYSLSCSL